MHFNEKFDVKNIDGQHPRPLVLAILLETIERESFDGLLAFTNYIKILPHQKLLYTVHPSFTNANY